jgi:exosome complex component RRP42
MAASQGEIEYCVASVRNGLRLDGRAWNELRPVEIELGVIAAAAGSARVKLGGTDVVVAVKVKANQRGFQVMLQACNQEQPLPLC